MQDVSDDLEAWSRFEVRTSTALAAGRMGPRVVGTGPVGEVHAVHRGRAATLCGLDVMVAGLQRMDDPFQPWTPSGGFRRSCRKFEDAATAAPA